MTIGIELRLDNARIDIIVDELNNCGYIHIIVGTKISEDRNAITS